MESLALQFFSVVIYLRLLLKRIHNPHLMISLPDSL
jgi:hypothetical protein